MRYRGKKLIIWGGGTTTAVRIQWLKKNYIVVAIVTNDDALPSDVCGINTIKKEDLYNFQFDYVLISALQEESDSILRDIEERGISKDLILTIKDVTENEDGVDVYAEDIVAQQIEVLADILNATDEQIVSYDWMLEKVRRFGIFPFGYAWCSDEKTNYVLYGLQQIPEEFAAFCVSISQMEIRTAMEIGVYRGRSSYFISAILGRKNSTLTYYMVDVVDRQENFERYKQILPWLKKSIPSTSEEHKGENYDFVFIDADHTYEKAIADYYNIGQYAKVIAVFHDIYSHEYDCENGGTVRMWREILENTQEKQHSIFSVCPDRCMGIGVVFS